VQCSRPVCQVPTSGSALEGRRTPDAASDAGLLASAPVSQTPLRRAPVPRLPALHQLVLPTPWQVGPVQVYLVDAEPRTLIDTGVRSAASRAALEAGLDALGYGLEDVRRIVLTHWHGDHLGQAETLRRAGGDVEVWTHVDEAPWCEHFSKERDLAIEDTEALFREAGVPEEILAAQTAQRRKWLDEDPLCERTRVDHVLREGDRIAFKDFALEVIQAPGHTEGHLLLHEPASGVLLTGDHLMGDAVPFTDYHYVDGAPDPADPLARRPRFRGLPRYLASLRALRTRRFRTLLPAHGGVLDRPARVIDDALLFYEVRVQRVERALGRAAGEEGGPVSPWAVWRRVFPHADPVGEMRNRMYLVLGALDLFEAEGRVAVERDASGALRYRPVEG
jgi:glyoxylase-like metal-dependent hydrolase (beta-lactamase superfamily II)